MRAEQSRVRANVDRRRERAFVRAIVRNPDGLSGRNRMESARRIGRRTTRRARLQSLAQMLGRVAAMLVLVGGCGEVLVDQPGQITIEVIVAGEGRVHTADGAL